jgi:hypothetical protein
MQKFSDFAQEECRFSEDKIPLDNVVGKQIVVHAYYLQKSNFKDSLNKERMTMLIEFGGEKRVVFTKSEVLIRQMRQYEKHLPFETIIIHPKRYYTFS